MGVLTFAGCGDSVATIVNHKNPYQSNWTVTVYVLKDHKPVETACTFDDLVTCQIATVQSVVSLAVRAVVCQTLGHHSFT